MNEWMNATRWPGKKRMALSTLKRFLKQEPKAGYTSYDQMSGLWDYLSAKYTDDFPERATPTVIAEMRSDELLSLALTQFFCKTARVKHKHKLEDMTKTMPGEYVMYRPDWEPAARDLSPQEGMRVSLINIRPTERGLLIKETQDNDTPGRGKHFQVNNGVLFPYGEYIIALMNCEQRPSFKCIIVEEYGRQFDDPNQINEFKGKILVASAVASFPSAKFVCRRRSGKEKLGIRPYREIDKNIRASIAAPTFDKKYRVVSS